MAKRWFWTTAKRFEILPCDMTDKHLVNAFLMVRRWLDDDHPPPWRNLDYARSAKRNLRKELSRRVGVVVPGGL